MSVLLIAVAVLVAFAVAYRLYGRWLARTVFELDDSRGVPACELRDDQDFVPTDRAILFGHHFTSIAGTGPIVGPALAVMWGWAPALLWVVLGSIFIGAVHDFGSLIISVRSRGQTIGDVAGRVLNRRVRLLFLLILFMALTIVLAIFGLVIAAVFRMFPSAIFPCLVQIPIAIAIGIWLHRRGANLTVPSVIALALMYATLVLGDQGLLGDFNASLAAWPTMGWVIVLLVYSYIASVLPVWMLLQPRDYINSLQLITALGLVLLGLLAAAWIGGTTAGGEAIPLTLVAPAFRGNVADAPMIFPFLFITIACGACSGFHCLVSSGTSSKQIAKESDALPIGFGSMLTEGFLATLVILACTAGIGLGVPSLENPNTMLFGSDAYAERYASWSAANGLAAKIGAFVAGSANFLTVLGLSQGVSVAIMGVLVASFAGTTLDTACRLQRYVIQELAMTLAGHRQQNEAEPLGKQRTLSRFNPLVWLSNKHAATLFAILLAALIAVIPAKSPPVSIIQAWHGELPLAEMHSGEMSGGATSDAGHSGILGVWDWAAQYGGSGGMILWPLFGATNQLLAGLALLVISFYLWRRARSVVFVALPMVFMLLVPAIGMSISIPQWLDADSKNWVAISVGIATLVLELWMIVEAILLWPRVRGLAEATAV
ncbi:MAG: carbon starvation protein A [Planctomycetota bacterium]